MNLIVSETATSTWHYHLREVGPEGPKYGGAAGTALCGTPLGWDTRTPVGTFMQEVKHSTTWHPCTKCRELARERGLAK